MLNIGDRELSGSAFIKWSGRSPFKEGNIAGRFYCGEVKPLVYILSPFEKTLYLDADTLFCKSPMPGFDRLEEDEFLVWQDGPIAVLGEDKFVRRYGYSKECVLDTIAMNGSDPGISSARVFFFRKCLPVARLFSDWYAEYTRYQCFDDQIPMVKALCMNKNVKVGRLSEEWNTNQEIQGKIIHHNIGTQAARD